MEPITLSTARLVLRPWQFTDLDAVVSYADDPLYSRFLPLPQPYGRRDGEEFISRAVLASWDNHPMFATTIDNIAIGGVDLHLALADGVASIGYSLGQAHWGNGFTLEAATAVINWPSTPGRSRRHSPPRTRRIAKAGE